ncbi:MAG: hypothetical protein ACREFB_18375 [Stellaceae bacterium]
MTARSGNTRLYHGTTALRLQSILRDGRLRADICGWMPPKVSLTPDREVAEYFAMVSDSGDHHDHPQEETGSVVLTLDRDAVERLARLQPYSDCFWGDGECDWERELVAGQDIELQDVLVAVRAPTEKQLERANAHLHRLRRDR